MYNDDMDDIKILISEEEIDKRICELGEEISRDYAGNVRELRNVVMEAAYAADGNEIEAKDIRGFHYDKVQSTSLRDMQCAMIRERLQEYRHNISQTANVLGIHRNTLRRLAAKLGIRK